mgnify:CR=1 FL=1
MAMVAAMAMALDKSCVVGDWLWLWQWLGLFLALATTLALAIVKALALYIDVHMV